MLTDIPCVSLVFTIITISGMLSILLLLLLPLSASPWEVLFVNVFATRSHQTVSGYTANLLAEHGHHVTYISTNIPNYLRSEITKITLSEIEKIGNTVIKKVDDPDFSLGKMLPSIKTMLLLCDPFFVDPNVQHLITKQARFDVMIAFGALYDSCAFALAHKLNITARITQFPAPATFPAQMSAYGLPIYHSAVNYDGVSYQDPQDVKNSMLLRVKNIFKTGIIMMIEDIAQRWFIGPAIYTHVPDYPGYFSAYQKVGLVLMHQHPLTDYPVPFGPGVVPLGGTLCTDYQPEAFSAELIEFLDSSIQGFVYLSFGSIVNTLLDVEKEILIGAFAKLSYNVVWKIPGDIPNLPPNVKTFSWLPQMSLLRHPNLRAFITHGGYASKIEAMCAGVPMLVIPRTAFDQYQNAELVRSRGLGDKLLSLRDSTSEVMYAKVMNITGDDITMRSKSLQRQLLATRTSPTQLLGYLDIVISGHSLLPGYQPFWEYFYLDILLIPVLVMWLVKALVSRIRG